MSSDHNIILTTEVELEQLRTVHVSIWKFYKIL